MSTCSEGICTPVYSGSDDSPPCEFVRIDMCPLHEAAPDLLKVAYRCLGITNPKKYKGSVCNPAYEDLLCEVRKLTRTALAKTEMHHS